jgi:PAS domain S-box-containing protein
MHGPTSELDTGASGRRANVRAWPLKAEFLIFGLILVLPVTLLAAFFLLQIASSSREQTEARMLQVAAGVAHAVDRDLQKRITILETLAASPALDRADLSYFHAVAAAVMKEDKAGIFLIDAGTQQQLVNTYRPHGTPLPTYGSPETATRVLQSHTWQISDFFIGRVSQRPAFDILLPVLRNRQVKYLLAMGLEPFMLRDILLGQKLSPDWVLTVADRSGTILARSSGIDELVGRKLSPELFTQEPNIIRRFAALDGVAALRSVARSELAGWQVAVSVPVELVEGQTRRSLLWLGLLSAATLLLTVLLASWFARVTAKPIALAAKAAADLAQRAPVPAFASRIREANDLMAALQRAGAELADAEEKRQAAVQSLRESSARKTAILDSALDAIVAMDQEGRIIDFNPAAEKLFGRRQQDVLGKTVADTIVPERLRQSHWSGLHRFLQTGTSKVVGRHIELPALRADGSEFPAELAIVVTPLDKGERIFTAYLRDISERKRAAKTEKLLSGELEHRTNNLFAVVDAIADQTLRGERSLKEARELFGARIRALARTHQQLTKANWAGLTLQEIARRELEPFAARITIEGPDVLLNSHYAQNFSLALHELGTNAMKYGALSVPTGQVSIRWTAEEAGGDGHLKLQWRESGGPPVTTPVRQGFGTLLLRSTFSGAEIEYPPEGFRCALAIPLGDLRPSPAAAY